MPRPPAPASKGYGTFSTAATAATSPTTCTTGSTQASVSRRRSTPPSPAEWTGPSAAPHRAKPAHQGAALSDRLRDPLRNRARTGRLTALGPDSRHSSRMKCDGILSNLAVCWGSSVAHPTSDRHSRNSSGRLRSAGRGSRRQHFVIGRCRVFGRANDRRCRASGSTLGPPAKRQRHYIDSDDASR